MFTASENFDIADLKRSSVKMKGALQAEWQEMIRAESKGDHSDAHADFGGLEIVDDQSRAFLPRIDLTLKMASKSNGVSYVPSLTNLQNATAAYNQLSC